MSPALQTLAQLHMQALVLWALAVSLAIWVLAPLLALWTLTLSPAP